MMAGDFEIEDDRKQLPPSPLDVGKLDNVFFLFILAPDSIVLPLSHLRAQEDDREVSFPTKVMPFVVSPGAVCWPQQPTSQKQPKRQCPFDASLLVFVAHVTTVHLFS